MSSLKWQAHVEDPNHHPWLGGGFKYAWIYFHLSLWKITKPFDSYLIQTGQAAPVKPNDMSIRLIEWVLQVSEWKMEVPAGDFEEEATVGRSVGSFDIETGWNHPTSLRC